MRKSGALVNDSLIPRMRVIDTPRHCVVSFQHLHYETSKTLERKSNASHPHPLNPNQ